jgi:NDP-hexose-3-ketoreductase
MTPVRFAVLGAAEIAWRRMLPAMAAVAEAEPVVVATARPGGADHFAERYGVATADGYEAALARDDVDAVYLPLPNALHARWAERALETGRHVLVEKPLATDAPAAARLTGLARSLGLTVMENMMFVRHRQHAELLRLVEAGRVGRPTTFAAAFTVPPRPDGDIRYRAELGGGALLDTGVYPIRAAQHVLGEDLEVLGAVLRDDAGRGVDLGGSALLLSGKGVTAHLEFGFDRPYRCSYEISGPGGTLRLDRAFTPPPEHHATARWIGTDGRTEDLPLGADDQFANTLRSFTAVVRRGDDGGHAAASLAQARLLDRIRDAARRVPA